MAANGRQIHSIRTTVTDAALAAAGHGVDVCSIADTCCDQTILLI
jgi:hypothetical protein